MTNKFTILLYQYFEVVNHSFPKALFLLDDAELIKLKCVTMQIGCVCPFLHGVHCYSPFFLLLCSELQLHQHYMNYIVLLLYEVYLAQRIFINKHTCISKQASSVFIHHLCTLPTHYVTALRLKKMMFCYTHRGNLI